MVQVRILLLFLRPGQLSVNLSMYTLVTERLHVFVVNFGQVMVANYVHNLRDLKTKVYNKLLSTLCEALAYKSYSVNNILPHPPIFS